MDASIKQTPLYLIQAVYLVQRDQTPDKLNLCDMDTSTSQTLVIQPVTVPSLSIIKRLDCIFLIELTLTSLQRTS